MITMSYDEHYAGSKEAGPVSSISYVTNSIQEVGEEVPAEQMVIALSLIHILQKDIRCSAFLMP